MTFVHWAGLASLLLVLAPVAAHLLRRRRAIEQPFPATAIVPASPPAARRRSKLEDRPLFALRALAIILLALLGATPLVRCSRLSLGRNAGASVALSIVIDDSMSMRAASPGAPSHFERAKRDASDLVAGSREGDAIGLVLAGSPARVLLSPSTDLKAASRALSDAAPSDRATDLDGAIALARSALKALPHQDKRIVVLTDRADGHPEAPPIGEGSDIPLWAPDRVGDSQQGDCAIVRADRRRDVVTVRVVCTGSAPARGRSLEPRAQGKPAASRPLPAFDDTPVSAQDLALDLRSAPDPIDTVALTGPADSIADNDVGPVGVTASDLAVAVVADRSSTVVTGGRPAVEQAIEALESGVLVRPLPAVPETAEELSSYMAIVIDDPPGLTPEMRRALGGWLDKGGVALIALGPRAASAPIGSSLEPFLTGASRWESSAPAGIDVPSGAILGASAEGLAELHARGRSAFDNGPRASMQVQIKWSDGAPFLVQRTIGRGSAWAIGLPLSPDESDLVVRPAFLALLDLVIESARTRGSSRRVEVGTPWVFDKATEVQVRNQAGPIPVELQGDHKRVVPAIAGRYDIQIAGLSETRFATVPERELDFRRRRLAETSTRADLGGTSSQVDVSRYIAFILLGVLVLEMLLRAFMSIWERKHVVEPEAARPSRPSMRSLPPEPPRPRAEI